MFARSPVGFAMSFDKLKIKKPATFDIFDDTPPSDPPSYFASANSTPEKTPVPTPTGEETISGNNIFFDKQSSSTQKLASPIRRVHYSDLEGNEVLPRLNPLLPFHFDEKRTILYGVGSLYTSLIPSLIVEGVGSAIASVATPQLRDRVKILMLNGTLDRETPDYTAMDFILAITDALNYSTW
jgi:hypothetical protein